MKLKTSLPARSFLLSGLLVLTLAQAGANPNAKEYVTLGTIKPIQLKQGGKQEVSIPATILKGHHIQANPATLPNLIATELSLEPISGLELGSPSYPKSKPWRLMSAGKVIQTYEGSVVFKIGLNAKTLAPGKYEIKGSLRYQACDEKNCFFPTSAPIAIPLTVVK